jgi:flagellar biosynthesis/type III secretory pathway M-ring protein FliF/YscJ
VGVLVPAVTTAEQLQQIEDLVSMAVGLDPSRGDAMAVHAASGEILPFEGEQMPHTAIENAAPEYPRHAELAVEQVPDSKPATNTMTTGLQGLWMRYPEFFVIGGIAILLVLLFIASLELQARRRQHLKRTRLLTHERERILSQLKTWINADEIRSQSEANS